MVLDLRLTKGWVRALTLFLCLKVFVNIISSFERILGHGMKNSVGGPEFGSYEHRPKFLYFQKVTLFPLKCALLRAKLNSFWK